MPSRHPLPIFPPAGTHVRIWLESWWVEGIPVERTALAWTAGDPVQDGETWKIPVVGHGLVPAGRVREVR